MQNEIIPTKLDEIPQEWKDSLRQSEIAVRIESVSEITDEDFKCFERSVLLPTPSKGLSEAIGINGKRTLLKRGVFAKNAIRHPDLSPEDSRNIIGNALYSPDKYGKNRPVTKPNYWVAIKSSVNSSVVVIEVSETKNYVEIVGWRYANERNLAQLEKQAQREGGQFLILFPEGDTAAGLSTLPSDLTMQKYN